MAKTLEQLPALVGERHPGETDTAYRARTQAAVQFSELLYVVLPDGSDRKLFLDALRMILVPTAEVMVDTLAHANENTIEPIQSDFNQLDPSKPNYIRNRDALAQELGIQANAAETDVGAPSFIQNKVLLQADWTEGDSQNERYVRNKPGIASGANDGLMSSAQASKLANISSASAGPAGTTYTQIGSTIPDFSIAQQDTLYNTGIPLPAAGYIRVQFVLDEAGENVLITDDVDVARVRLLSPSSGQVASSDILPLEESIASYILYGHNSSDQLMIGLTGTPYDNLQNLAVYELGASAGGGTGNAAPWAQTGNNDTIPDPKIPTEIARVSQISSALTPLDKADIAQAITRTSAIEVAPASWVATSDDIGVAVVDVADLATSINSATFVKTTAAPLSDEAGKSLVIYRTVTELYDYRIEELDGNSDVVRVLPIVSFTVPVTASVAGTDVIGRAFALAQYSNEGMSFTHETGHTFRVRKAAFSATWIGDYAADSVGLANMESGVRTKISGISDNAEANVQSDWNEASTTSDAYIKNKPSINVANKADTDLQNISSTLTTNQRATVRGRIGAGISDFDGAYNSLTGKPAIPDVSTKADTDLQNISSTLSNSQQTTVRSRIGAGTSDFDGAYSSLTGVPAAVDLTNKADTDLQNISSGLTTAQQNVVKTRLGITNVSRNMNAIYADGTLTLNNVAASSYVLLTVAAAETGLGGNPPDSSDVLTIRIRRDSSSGTQLYYQTRTLDTSSSDPGVGIGITINYLDKTPPTGTVTYYIEGGNNNDIWSALAEEIPQ